MSHSNNIKKHGSRLAILLSFVIILTSVVLPLFGNNQAHADKAQDMIDGLCVPKFTRTSDGSHFYSNSFHVTVINRAHLKVTYTPSGNCYKPSNLNSAYISATKNTTWASVIGKSNFSNFLDSNEDDNINYSAKVGKDSTDDSDIDNFKGSWPTNGNYGAKVPTSKIPSIIDQSELNISLEEDTLSLGPDICPDVTNGNVHLNTHTGSKNIPNWDCSSGDKGYTLENHLWKDVANLNITYAVTGSGDGVKIIPVTQKQANDSDKTFTWCAALTPKRFATDDCNGDKSISASLATVAAIKGNSPTFLTVKDGSKTYSIGVAGKDSQSSKDAASAESSGDSNGGKDDGSGGASDESTCGMANSALNWIICPMFNMLKKVADEVNNMITNMMDIDTCVIFNKGSDCKSNGANNKDTSGAYHAAWGSMRNIALLLIVLVGFIMVIAQALGSQAIDAYTIKSVMPRLLVAAVFIALSWILMQFIIEFTNVLGLGIRSLIYAPFSHLASSAPGGHDSAGWNILGGVGIASTLFVGAAIALSSGALVSLAGSMVLGILVGFLVIVLRQIIIVFLVIIAPIAIAMYALPNTQKAFKMWWETFIKALLMFPIIIGFIAVGRVFSLVAFTQANNGTDGSTLMAIVAIIAYIIPFFLLPFTFKMAGSVMGGVATAVHGAAKKPRAALKKRGVQQMGDTFKNTRGYNRFSDRNKLTRSLNKVGGAATNPWRDLNPRDLVKGKTGIESGRQQGMAVVGATNWKENEIAQANAQDDDFLVAVADEGFAVSKRDQAKANLQNAVESGDQAEIDKYRAELDSRQRGLDLASKISPGDRKSSGFRQAAFMQLASTGYQFSAGRDGLEEMRHIATDLAGGDEATAGKLMDNAQFSAKQGGRLDLGGINHGQPVSQETVKSGFKKLGNYGRGQGKVDTYHGGAKAYIGSDYQAGEGASGIANRVNNGSASLDDLAEYHEMLRGDMPGATDANKDVIRKQIADIEAYAQQVNSGPTPDTEEELNAHTDFVRRIQNNTAQARGYIDPSEREKIHNPPPPPGEA